MNRIKNLLASFVVLFSLYSCRQRASGPVPEETMHFVMSKYVENKYFTKHSWFVYSTKPLELTGVDAVYDPYINDFIEKGKPIEYGSNKYYTEFMYFGGLTCSNIRLVYGNRVTKGSVAYLLSINGESVDVPNYKGDVFSNEHASKGYKDWQWNSNIFRRVK